MLTHGLPAGKLTGGRADVIDWLKRAAIRLAPVKCATRPSDMDALGNVIGEATVVALSEAVHGALEPLEIRNRLFQYLVREKGFTAIAIESGIVEGKQIHDYVLGGPGHPTSVVSRGMSWNFDSYVSNHELVQWIRQYNADPRQPRKIHFYGFDVPGSPGNVQAASGIEVALVETLAYLAKVDKPAAQQFQARLNALLPRLWFDFQRPENRAGYDGLDAAERNAVTAAITDLTALLERQETTYTSRSGPSDYEWACRVAIGARQTDNWLRQIPPDWQPPTKQMTFPSKETEFFAVATDVRDRAQADNLDWIIRREGAGGKVLVHASRFHLSTAPVMTGWSGPRQQQVAGTYLRRRLGNRLISIGNLVGQGEFDSLGVKIRLSPAEPESLDGLVSEAGIPHFLADLRSAPAPVTDWLAQELPVGRGEFDLSPSRAFDVLWYLNEVTPAWTHGIDCQDQRETPLQPPSE